MRKNIYKFFYLVSILLTAIFIINLIVDYKDYKIYSSPFYVYIVVRTLEFLLPSILIFIIGNILKKKATESSDQHEK